MLKFARIGIALAIALLASVSRSAEPPGDVAGAYFRAISSADWRAMSNLMHPDALASFRRFMVQAASSKGGMEMLHEVLHVATKEEVENYPAGKMFQDFWKGLAEAQPDIVRLLISSENAVIGYVSEGDRLAHVVVRTSVQQTPEVRVTLVDVVSLQKDGDNWRMLLTTNLELMAQRLASQ